MNRTQYHSYRDNHKTIPLHRTTFVTLKAIEQWSSDKSQSGIIRIRLCCAMTLRLKSADKTNPNQKATFWPNGLPKSSNSPYFSGFFIPLFMSHCDHETPENPTAEPNPKSPLHPSK
jgi:hypothetical protein